MKLILIDGQPGSGKTEMSKHLLNTLTGTGENCMLVDEGDQEAIFGDVWENYDEKSITSIETIKCRWDSFVKSNSNKDIIYIMDNTLMNHVQYFMAVKNDKNEINEFFKYIDSRFHGIDAKMIFLDGDSNVIIRRINEIRKNGWGQRVSELFSEYPYQRDKNRSGLEGMVEFFSDSQVLKRELIKLWEQPVITIDVTDANWQLYKRLAEDFIMK